MSTVGSLQLAVRVYARVCVFPWAKAVAAVLVKWHLVAAVRQGIKHRA